MADSSRRTLLRGTAGLLALTAGCIADDLGGPSDSDGAENDDGDDSTEDEGTDSGDSDDESADDVEETDSRVFRHAEPTSEPGATLFLEREAAEEWLAERRLDDEESVAEFVDQTSFEESSLTAVEAGAPNLCYELHLESAAVESGRLEVEATVSDEESDEVGCAQQETTVGALVRASDGGEPVSEGTATIVDREGDERELELDEDDESDSE